MQKYMNITKIYVCVNKQTKPNICREKNVCGDASIWEWTLPAPQACRFTHIFKLQ